MVESRSIGILAYDGVDARTLVTVHDVLAEANLDGAPVEPVVYSLVPSDGVTAASGIGLVPDDVLIGTPDVVVVPGGAAEEDDERTPTYPDELPDRLDQLAGAGATVVGVGAGVLALGQAGLLDDRSATTAPEFRDAIADFGATLADGAVVAADGVATATGPDAAVDLAEWLLEDA
ncbi:MAG: DJ-1/PfpI family protein [Halanaeroarchaeum sp.]